MAVQLGGLIGVEGASTDELLRGLPTTPVHFVPGHNMDGCRGSYGLTRRLELAVCERPAGVTPNNARVRSSNKAHAGKFSPFTASR